MSAPRKRRCSGSSSTLRRWPIWRLLPARASCVICPVWVQSRRPRCWPASSRWRGAPRPAGRWGTLLQYFNGSKEHSVKLRELALRKGLSLSEHAFTTVGSVSDPEQEILCTTETEVYRTLGLPYIAPELREDRGEIEAALKGVLPRLVELRELQSELHAHTTWSDGALSIRSMAQAARSRG